MTVKNFFVDALTAALDLGIAKPDDVIKHVTADVLSIHLPRPLWARLLTACIGAPKVDAQLIVETIGVSNLCEHIPAPIIWSVIADVGARSLGNVAADTRAIPVAIPVAAGKSEPTTAPKKPTTTPATGTPVLGTPAAKRPPQQTPPKPLSVASPPPVETRTSVTPAPPPPGPSIPAPGAGGGDTVDDDAARGPARARTPTGQRFRQTSTNIGRLAASQRRPQANVATEPNPTVQGTPGSLPRMPTRNPEIDIEIETEVGNAASGDWRNAIAIEDDQLVDWSSSEETQTSTDDAAFRKR